MANAPQFADDYHDNLPESSGFEDALRFLEQADPSFDPRREESQAAPPPSSYTGRRISMEDAARNEATHQQHYQHLARQNDAPALPANYARNTDELCRGADFALAHEDYDAAILFLQEAVRIAPLRSDLRDKFREVMSLRALYGGSGSEVVKRKQPAPPAAPPKSSGPQPWPTTTTSNSAPAPAFGGEKATPSSFALGSIAGSLGLGRGDSDHASSMGHAPTAAPNNVNRYASQLAPYRPKGMPWGMIGGGIAILLLILVVSWPILQNASLPSLFESPELRTARDKMAQADSILLRDPAKALTLLGEAKGEDELSEEENARITGLMASAHERIGSRATTDRNFETAYQHLAWAVELEPTSAEYHAALAAAYYQGALRAGRHRASGDIDSDNLNKALAALEEAIRLDPNESRHLTLAADICVKLGQAPRAYPYWKRILKVVDRDHPHYRSAIKSLQSHGVSI